MIDAESQNICNDSKNEQFLQTIKKYNKWRLIRTLILTISTIIYTVCGITFLIINKNNITTCPESHILFYIVVCICLFAISNLCFENLIKSNMQHYKIGQCVWIIVAIIVFHILILGWGIIELYIIPNNINNNTQIPDTFVNNTACGSLKETNIWHYGYATIVVICISILINIILIFYYLSKLH